MYSDDRYGGLVAYELCVVSSYTTAYTWGLAPRQTCDITGLVPGLTVCDQLAIRGWGTLLPSIGLGLVGESGMKTAIHIRVCSTDALFSLHYREWKKGNA